MNFREEEKKKYLTSENRFYPPTLDGLCQVVKEIWTRSHKQSLQVKEIALWFCRNKGFYLKKVLHIHCVAVKWIRITCAVKRHWYPKGVFFFLSFFNGGGGKSEKTRNSKSCEKTVNQPEVKDISFRWNFKILTAVCNHSVDKEFQCVYEVNHSHLAPGLK